MQPIKSVLPFCSALPIQYTQALLVADENTALHSVCAVLYWCRWELACRRASSLFIRQSVSHPDKFIRDARDDKQQHACVAVLQVSRAVSSLSG